MPLNEWIINRLQYIFQNLTACRIFHAIYIAGLKNSVAPTYWHRQPHMVCILAIFSTMESNPPKWKRWMVNRMGPQSRAASRQSPPHTPELIYRYIIEAIQDQSQGLSRQLSKGSRYIFHQSNLSAKSFVWWVFFFRLGTSKAHAN